MKRTLVTLAAVVTTAWLGGLSASAQVPLRPPTIYSVTLDASAGVLTITGVGFTDQSVVTVDGQPAVVLPGGAETRLAVQAPAVLLTTPGSYRLTVVDPARQLGDAFVVAIPAGSIVTLSDAEPARAAHDARTVAPSREGSLETPTAGRTAPVPKSSGVSPHLVEGATNTAVGQGALFSNTTGSWNTASGVQALYSNISGPFNTASGAQALYANTTGSDNTATGYTALRFNTTGAGNTATGFRALYSNTTANNNTAHGWQALYSNTTGTSNTASGHLSLFANTTGSNNTGVGVAALAANTTGSGNSASGYQALASNTTGFANTAAGAGALYANVVGVRNTAGGYAALAANVYGTDNVALGHEALTGSQFNRWNVSVGAEALRWAGSDGNTGVGHNALGLLSGGGGTNTAVGYQAGAQLDQGTGNIYVGANVSGSGIEHYTTRLGAAQNRAFIAGVYGAQLTAPATAVYIDASGQLGTIQPASPPPTGGTGGSVLGGPPALAQQVAEQQATIAQLQEQARTQQALIGDLLARLARLEAAGAKR